MLVLQQSELDQLLAQAWREGAQYGFEQAQRTQTGPILETNNPYIHDKETQ